jgi:hypothetical protein
VTAGWILVGIAIGVVFAAWRQTSLERGEVDLASEAWVGVLLLAESVAVFAQEVETYLGNQKVGVVAEKGGVVVEVDAGKSRLYHAARQLQEEMADLRPE